MKPANAKEYAEQLRLEGCEWSSEILDALDYLESPEQERAENCQEELQALVPLGMESVDPWRMGEWVRDRLDRLEAIEKLLEGAGLGNADADDAVEKLIDTVSTYLN